MSTESQTHANRQNAQHSTGPVTDSGKSSSSRNALTLGLYTRADYVEPHEHDIYKEFCETMFAELSPETLLEESLTAEITGATWRLRRCSAAEAGLADYATQDPMFSDKTEKTLRSIERARASSHTLLHRSINQLRKLKTDRLTRSELFEPDDVPAWAGLADYKSICAAVYAQHRSRKAGLLSVAEIEAFCNPPLPREPRDAAAAEPQDLRQKEALASNCNPAQAIQIPRNATCPCGSSRKYKRCCGRNAAPVLHKGAKIAA